QFSIGAHVYKKLLLMAGVRGERVWLEDNIQLSISSEILDNWNIFGRILFDNTDDKYFPRKGVNFSFETESMGSANFSSQVSTKLVGKLDIHFPVSRNQTISTFIFAGTSINGLPVYENFKTGGPYDLPGNNRDEVWSEHVFVGKLKYRLNIFKNLYFKSGFSIANVGGPDLFSNNLIQGVFAGVMVDFPLGPVSLFYGWNEEDREQIYFSMGYNF
ncbi:MAG: BamA/TamA family outer membrane protein, partial [Spirochaetales bacterium]|nr:BamA/TamA family outer membrane protein [Spirochaetales bacterium]